jgi:1-acyl-sn-glycerol-3-phosphate acyltransferase
VLNYYWRLLATLWGFISFSLGGLLISVTLFPWFYVVVRDPLQRKLRAQYVVYRIFGIFLSQLCFLGVMKLTVHQRDKLQNAPGKLVIANHPCLLDVVSIISVLPRADCVVKSALWRHPFLAWVVRGASYIRNDNDAEKLLDRCVASIKQGNPLVIFPEGTRTKPGQPLKFQRGAANIAVRGDIDILPITVSCYPTTLTKADKWYHIPSKPFHLQLWVGDVIQTQKIIADCEHNSTKSRRLTQYLLDYYTKEIESHERTRE